MYTTTQNLVPGGWPNDMLLRLKVGPEPILRLLFARVSRNLPTAIALPPISGIPVSRVARTDQDGAAAWDTEWQETWRRAGDVERQLSDGHIPHAVATSSAFQLDPREEADYTRWRTSLADPADEVFEDQRERSVLSALVPAWQAGLRSIFILPLTGD